MLDVLCRQDPSFLYRTLSCLKALHVRLCGDTARARALLPIARFFLSHGESRGPGDSSGLWGSTASLVYGTVLLSGTVRAREEGLWAALWAAVKVGSLRLTLELSSP